MSAVKDKNIEVNGKVIGGESLIRMNVKTAMWILGGIFSLVMTILTWSYFDLKAEVRDFEAADSKAQKEFVEKVDEKLDDIEDDITTILVDQRELKTDIKHILDKQTRDNPVVPNPNRTVESTTPPE